MLTCDYRIHEYNTAFLLTTFLPYHTLPAFATLLSILPANLPPQYRFLHPYIRSLTQPPRNAIVFAATNEPTFATLLNSYVIRICNAGQSYPALTSFWACAMTEAVSSMLDKARSGRQAVQAEKQEEIVLRLLPTLNEGLAMRKASELRVGCYMLLTVMASKGGLNDKLLTAMMEAVVMGWTADTYVPGLICLTILAQQKRATQVTKRLIKQLLKVSDLSNLLLEIAKQHRIAKLANGIALALTDRLGTTGDASTLPLIEQLLQNGLLDDAQMRTSIKALILIAYTMDEEIDAAGVARRDLAQTLTTLAESAGKDGLITRKTFEEESVDIDVLEMRLQASVRPRMIAPPTEDVDMDEAEEDNTYAGADFATLMSEVPKHNGEEVSFLSHTPSTVFNKLVAPYSKAVGIQPNMQAFDAALFSRSGLLEYLTFYIRVWSGPYPVLAKSSAIQIVSHRLSTLEDKSTDFQAMIPFIVSALADPAAKVRRSAAELAMRLTQAYPADAELKKSKVKPWAQTAIYGAGKISKDVSWMSAEQAARFLRDIVTPALEECVLDKQHVVALLEKNLNAPEATNSPKKNAAAKPSQSLRLAILSGLASHVIHMPLYAVKFRLLGAINQVRAVGSTTRTDVLLPLLHGWCSLTQEAAQQNCQAEQIDIQDYDNQAVAVVVPNDVEGFQTLASIAKGEIAASRPSLCAAVFARFRDMWPSLIGDVRLSTAQLMMDLSQWPAGEAGPSEYAQGEAMELLRSVDLTTDILLSFLDQLPTAAKLANAAPASKRRRVSHGEVAKAPLSDSHELTAAIQKVTFVLQLVDSNEPENHTMLLTGLFNTLSELQHFKIQVGSELGYLQGLVLSSLLSIMKAHRADPKLKLDRSAVRADLLVDCVQKTASPQVQNAALLLIASLAETVPELVLHSVMPIFTFMGNSVLRQNDEYSAHVIKQTISQVIPPLIASLRQTKGDPVTGASELLLSFVAAYEHVPAHRRMGLYTSLVQTLGAEDFLFAVLAMLADKYGVNDDIKSFTVDLASTFSVDIQLLSAVKYLDLTKDALSTKPKAAAVLFKSHEVPDANRTALTQLNLLPSLLKENRLVDRTARLLERDDMEASRVRDLYSTLLENLLALADQVKSDRKLHAACGNVLESILGLLSTSEFVKSVESLLDRPNEELRRKILRSLEVRVEQEKQGNAAARVAMLAFLPTLTAIIRESRDVLYKHIAVSCVDKVAEKYGKKDLEGVSVAAETIAGEMCLGQEDERLQIQSLLCLASLVDILQEGIVSVLPVAIPRALDYMEKSVEKGTAGEKLHNAGYAFISALIEHLPYMISGSYLDRLLLISNKSAEGEMDIEADESRVACLDLAAKKIEAKSMFTALQKNFAVAAQTGTIALREYLDILSTSIDKHAKSVVTKHSPILSTIFMSAFDLRRQWSLNSEVEVDDEEITEIEGIVNDVAIKMIFKFNDSTFRPIFAKLVEWAATGLPKKDTTGRILRLQSIYSFMAVFFGNLKSIVTSYATYLTENVVEVLKSVDVKSEASVELWARVLRTLVKCFEHDQDEFWQSPSHFEPVAAALTEQFRHAAVLPLKQELTPAVVELAVAADSADHHKELNTTILKNLRSENAAVRLAAVKTEQALTERLGEEWLSLLPEMLPFISEAQEDDDEEVERETHRWIVGIEGVLGESLDSMLQ